jgi:D-alanyl-D-alanine dipeptidase
MNKILIHYTPAIFYGLLFLTITFPVRSQPAPNKYGLIVISKSKDYKASVAKNDNKAMLDVNNIPGIEIDLAYTKADNFMKTPLYPNIKTTYLRKTAVTALIAIQKELETKGLGIKIWDAYRPYSVTEKIWEPVKDERYAANPSTGSGHNRGIAVDLTLIKLDTKQELNMGTAFDHFSDTAHINFKGLEEEVLANRRLLRSVMERHGFISLETEWWHYYIPDSKNYELLDLSFRALSKLNKKMSAITK